MNAEGAGGGQGAERAGPVAAGAPHAPGLRFLALVLALLGANALALALLSFGPEGADAPAVLQGTAAFLSVAFLVAAGGLWFRRRWARPVAMTAAAALAMLLLLSMLRPAPGQSMFAAVLTLAAMLATLLYLQRPHVRAALR